MISTKISGTGLILDQFNFMAHHARFQRGDRGSDPIPGNHKYIGSLSNTGLDPLKNHKAFNVEPSPTRQRNAILITYCRRADDGPLIVAQYIDPSSPHQTKNVLKVGPPLTKLS